MNENRPCKKELLEWINIVSFAVDDVKLFLDTHPNCTEALEFFDEFKKENDIDFDKEFYVDFGEEQEVFNIDSATSGSINRPFFIK